MATSKGGGLERSTGSMCPPTPFHIQIHHSLDQRIPCWCLRRIASPRRGSRVTQGNAISLAEPRSCCTISCRIRLFCQRVLQSGWPIGRLCRRRGKSYCSRTLPSSRRRDPQTPAGHSSPRSGPAAHILSTTTARLYSPCPPSGLPHMLLRGTDQMHHGQNAPRCSMKAKIGLVETVDRQTSEDSCLCLGNP